ncbi:hypothetical protein WJX72_005245 [[Myrmecia] bisecta]|uniref:Chloride channel protein n=1 Tax=[Myrmecia] bisecta TaxID=41462 RepID=A0AAW1R6C1_9CHLO
MAANTPGNLLILALVFGTLTGLIAWVYNTYFEFLLWLVWEWAPIHVVQPSLRRTAGSYSWFPEADKVAWLYTLLVTTCLGTLAGVTQRLLGSPGDLPETVRCIHEKGSIPIRTAPSMFICSAFSIAAGGSLGPEAALLALCGSSVSFVAKHVFGFQGQKLRNCALMGMTAGLAAFFGVALGGSLFALEVLHRTGLQFYEVATYAVATGTICLVVFRALSGLPFGSIWDFQTADPSVLDYRHVLVGVLMGMVAAVAAIVFMKLHAVIKWVIESTGLQEHHTPILSGLSGGLLIGVIGVLCPPTLFWGEYEIQTLADPSHPLPHIWPKGGVYGLDPFRQGDYTFWLYLLIAGAKFVAISISVLSGFRGGFIFPLFFAGTALGHAISSIPGVPFISSLSPVMLCMPVAAGLNSAITRTPFSTSLILAILSGHPEVTVPCLASSLVALFLTLDFPFILSQRDRQDIIIKEIELLDEDGNPGGV